MDKYDVFIIAGQSNAEGSGYGPVTEEFCPDPRILFLNVSNTATVVNNRVEVEYHDAPFSIDIADERDWELGGEVVRRGDLSLTFAQEYIRAGLLAPDRKILIVRAAIGGTSFQSHHWGMEDLLYLKMVEMVDYALSLNPENQLKGLLWHQGENDACEGNTEEQYYSQLTMLINSVKERYQCPKLPFICADFVYEWRIKLTCCSPIEQAQRRVAEAMRGEYLETDDLASNNAHAHNGDDVHYSRESLHILGRRYFAAYDQICKAISERG